MAHEYRYIFDDAVTKQKLGTLPLYGVSWSDFLSLRSAKSGLFTGTIRMDNDSYNPALILAWTTPSRVRLWVERDGQLVWGGLIWTRTYQSDGRSMQISAQTFDSYPSKVIYQTSGPAFSGVDKPYNILRAVWHYFDGTLLGSTTRPAFYDIGVVTETYHADTTNSTAVVTVDWPGNDFHYLQDFVNDMLKMDAEYRIRCYYDATGVRSATFESHRVGGLGTPAANTNQYSVLRYPGIISKYWMTDSATEAAHLIAGQAQALGDAQLRSKQFGTPPGIGLNIIRSYEVTSQAQLDAFVAVDLPTLQPPLQNPVYELAGENIDLSFNLGDYRRVVIDDPWRYPTGPVAGNVRIIGRQVTPESSDSVELVSLTVSDSTGLAPING
jgi:hypothetical protein